MRESNAFLTAIVLNLSCVLTSFAGADSKFQVPRTWTDKEIAELELPLAHPSPSPVLPPAEYYYRIPVRPIYKSYPVYHPDAQPPGYLRWLKEQEPEIAFKAEALKTIDDWIRAGMLVFEAPRFLFAEDQFRVDRQTIALVPLDRYGVMPFWRYVIRQKGKLELTFQACAMCHTRVLADGSVIRGAQGNFPNHQLFNPGTSVQLARQARFRVFGMPWLTPDPIMSRIDVMSLEEMDAAVKSIPPGVLAREGTSIFYPPKIPDLIGVEAIKYLDNTGLQRHRGIDDMMRYAAINQGMGELKLFGNFRMTGELPDPSTLTRYSDEQLYALALFIYSLKAPPNPNRLDAAARRGRRIFKREGCSTCHVSPLYTNNALLPVDGFRVPEDHKGRYEILPIVIGTDPNLALKTRRGTGYYKVPSLRGVWYRGPFEHNGSVATLEDWFDEKRLRDDYTPTGFRGYGVRTRAIRGHEFGLTLSRSEKDALILFLKTL